MRNNWNALLVHTCDIQRADVAVNTSLVRDRRVSAYTTLSSSVRCWFEPTGARYDFNETVGQTAIRTFLVHFNGGVTVREGDRLKKNSTYYLVKSVIDNTDQGFMIQCEVDEKNYAMQ